MKRLIIILLVLILCGCANYTVIKTIPDGAKVKQGSELMGVTPFDIKDYGLSFSSSTYTLSMEGYKDKEITVTKDIFYGHRLIIPPIFGLPWLYGYKPLYIYELEKSEKQNNNP